MEKGGGEIRHASPGGIMPIPDRPPSWLVRFGNILKNQDRFLNGDRRRAEGIQLEHFCPLRSCLNSWDCELGYPVRKVVWHDLCNPICWETFLNPFFSLLLERSLLSPKASKEQRLPKNQGGWDRIAQNQTMNSIPPALLESRRPRQTSCQETEGLLGSEPHLRGWGSDGLTHLHGRRA